MLDLRLNSGFGAVLLLLAGSACAPDPGPTDDEEECSDGLTSCEGACVDLDVAATDCGACGEVCADGWVCSLGNCSEGCGEELIECGGSCVDIDTSSAHCGSCDSPCEAGQSCISGACEIPQQVDCAAEEDACPFDGGITHACKTRFALGINYAWRNFAADFGGISAWEQLGVSQDETGFDADLAEMKAAGASVVRWWLWPDFRGDGVLFDEADDPTGLSDVALADIEKALELADKNDVYLVLTPFSFDNFRPTHETGGRVIRGLSDIVRSAPRRAKLIENVVRPMAKAVAGSEHASRLLGWDVINEPEWAVSPEGGNPSSDFTPNEELDDISLAEMKTFITETLAVLREETPAAQLSIGWAAAKWSWAFSDLPNVDFHQPHIYGWVNQYWPYTMSPAELGYTGKPTVMGELFLEEMPFTGNGDDSTLSQILQAFYDGGYAGAWPWQHYDYGQNLGLLQSFATDKGCPVSY